MQFDNFDSADYRAMFVLLERDLQIVLAEKDVHRDRLLRLCRRGQTHAGGESYALHSAYLLLCMLSIPKDPYILVFSILSAFMRC
jgi:hypothetical protein